MGTNQSSSWTKNQKNYRTLEISQHDIIFKKHALPDHYHLASNNLFYSSLTNKSFMKHTIKISSIRLQTIYQNFLYGLYNSDLIITPIYLQLAQKRESYTINFYTQHLRDSIKQIQCFQSIETGYRFLIQTLKGIQTFYHYLHNYKVEQKNILLTKRRTIKIRNQSDLMLHNIGHTKVSSANQLLIVTQVLTIIDKRNSKQRNHKIFQNFVFNKISRDSASIKSTLNLLIQSAPYFSTFNDRLNIQIKQDSELFMPSHHSYYSNLRSSSAELFCPKQKKIKYSQLQPRFNNKLLINKQNSNYTDNLFNNSYSFETINHSCSFQNSAENFYCNPHSITKETSQKISEFDPSKIIRNNDHHTQHSNWQSIKPNIKIVPSFLDKQYSQKRQAIPIFPISSILHKKNLSEAIYRRSKTNQKSTNINSRISCNSNFSLNQVNKSENQPSSVIFKCSTPNFSVQNINKSLRRNYSELIYVSPRNKIVKDSNYTPQFKKQQMKLNFKKPVLLNNSLVKKQQLSLLIDNKKTDIKLNEQLNSKPQPLYIQDAIKKDYSRCPQIDDYFIPIQQTNRQYDLQQVTQYFLTEQNSDRKQVSKVNQSQRYRQNTFNQQKNCRKRNQRNSSEVRDVNFRNPSPRKFSYEPGKVQFNPKPLEFYYEDDQNEDELSNARTLRKELIIKKQLQQNYIMDTIRQSEEQIPNNAVLFQRSNQSQQRVSISNNLKSASSNILNGLMTIKSIRPERSQSQISFVVDKFQFY